MDEIAERFLLTPGYIHRTAALAGPVAAIQGRDLAEPGDVQTASRALNRQVLDTLATPPAALDEAVRPVLTEAASTEPGSCWHGAGSGSSVQAGSVQPSARVYEEVAWDIDQSLLRMWWLPVRP